MKFTNIKWQFNYGAGAWQMVTVRAQSYQAAIMAARNELDKRYEKAGKEPPVGWTLDLIEATCLK
jgi:hypothetical protein